MLTRLCQSSYYNDTPTKTVQVFDYDLETGSVSNGRKFVDVDGMPDGMCMDGEGNVYIAVFNGIYCTLSCSVRMNSS